MPEPAGPDDERFVYVVTAAGLEAVREGAVVVDAERERCGRRERLDRASIVTPSDRVGATADR